MSINPVNDVLARISNSFEFEYEKNDVFVKMIEDFSDFVNSKNNSARVSTMRGLQVMLIIDKIKEASFKQNWVIVGTR